jgi:hypothetical protein
MEQDRDALLESYALRAPEALDGLSPEERHQVYRMLRLRAAVKIGGTLEVGGIGEGSGFCHSKTRSWTRFKSTKQSELRFNALLSDDTRERCASSG